MPAKKEGISFVVKIRNEEATLEKSIRSLFPLTIPHEIILVIHLCTDHSYDIALQLQKENPRIRIVSYLNEISRAGYENLATDIFSQHSLATYYNFCLAKCIYPWKFKWDADFLATGPLIRFLNGKIWSANERGTYRLKAISPESTSTEGYLSSSLVFYGKFAYWEVPIHAGKRNIITAPDDVHIIHDSMLKTLKTYWLAKPWYLTEKSEEADLVKSRIERLNAEFGKEPVGNARCCNNSANIVCKKIMDAKLKYVNLEK